MFETGFQEIVLVCIIGLLVLGPQRLPKVAAEIGKWVGRARRTATQLRRQLEREVELSELQDPPPPRTPPPPPPSSTDSSSGEVPPGPGTHAEQPVDSETAAAAAMDKGQPPAEPVASSASSADQRSDQNDPPKN